MSEFLNISAALDTQLNAMASVPPVAWENRPYKPVDGTLYLRPTLLAGDTVGATLSATGTDEHVGVYQIDVIGDAGKGKGEVVTMADLVADQFKPVTELTYSGTTVRCVRVSRGAARTEGSRYIISVDVQYLCYTVKR